MRIIDLTAPLDFDFTAPEKPFERPDMEMKKVYTLPVHGYQSIKYSLNTHSGTHLDVPAHRLTRQQKPTGIYYPEDIPLEWLYGTDNTVVLDCPKGEQEPIGARDFENAKIEIRENDIVLVCTGWGRYIVEEPKSDWYLFWKKPFLALDGAEWLVKRKVRAYGSDLIGSQSNIINPFSPTPEDQEKGIRVRSEPVHETLLMNDIILFEHLCNLDKVANRRITAGFFPMPLRGVDGVQIRALAFLED